MRVHGIIHAMNTHKKPRLKVIAGGFAGRFWHRKGFRFKRNHMRIVDDAVLDELASREIEIGCKRWHGSWIGGFIEAYAPKTHNPHFMDMLDGDTGRMILRLYRGGLTPEQAVDVMYRYMTGDYPFRRLKEEQWTGEP